MGGNNATINRHLTAPSLRGLSLLISLTGFAVDQFVPNKNSSMLIENHDSTYDLNEADVELGPALEDPEVGHPVL